MAIGSKTAAALKALQNKTDIVGSDRGGKTKVAAALRQLSPARTVGISSSAAVPSSRNGGVTTVTTAKKISSDLVAVPDLLQNGIGTTTYRTPVQQQVSAQKAQLQSQIDAVQKKLAAWQSGGTPSTAIPTQETLLQDLQGRNTQQAKPVLGESREALQKQLDSLLAEQRELEQNAGKAELEAAGTLREEAIREKNRQDYAALPDAGQAAGYLAGSYVGGLTDWAGGIINAVDAVLPNTETAVPGVAEFQRAKGRLENTVTDLGEMVSGVTRNIGGMVARGAGYSTPSALASMLGAGTAGSGIIGMLKSPTFWMSAVPTYGSSYAEAKAEGATETQAQLMAIANGFAGAAVEVGGGIETIPQTTGGIKNWIRGMLEEGGEEALQGVIEQLAQKATYEQEKEWFSLTDPDAVFSGSRALQEFLGGAMVGGVLGGGQIAAGSLIDYYNTVQVGNAYLRGADGVNIEAAVELGLSNAKGTDAYRAAEKIAARVQAGQRVSPYTLGRMVLESQTPAAQTARRIDTQVRQSAAQVGLPEGVTDTIAAAAVALEQPVVLVTPEALAVTAADGTVTHAAGRYDRGSGTVLLNGRASEEELTGFLLAHEMTHSAEGTTQWQTLADTVRRMVGEGTWNATAAQIREERAAVGAPVTPQEADREVLADWIGSHLFRQGFAQAVVSGDANTGTAFLRVIDKVRRAMGTKNSRSAGNIAMLERLFMQALENRRNTGSGNAPYAIVVLDNGKIYVQADRKVLTGTDKETWKQQIDNLFDKVLLQSGSLTVDSVEGDALTITKDETIWKGKDEHVQIGGKKRILTRGEYFVKLKALSHIDELAESSIAQRKPDGSHNVVQDEKNHPFAKDGFEYRTVYFQDFDGKYYRITLSVGLNDGIATVYNVGQIKETAAPDGRILSVIGSKARDAAVSDTTVAQNSFGVNTQSMPEGTEYAPNAFLPPERMQGTALQDHSLQNKKITDAPNTSQSLGSTDRHDASVIDTTVAQNAPGVNTQSMPAGTEYAPNAFLPSERLFMQALENRRNTGSGNVAYSINPDFVKEYDRWDKKDPRKVFEVGTTSEVLKSLGVPERKITWDAAKIIKIRNQHREMTDNIIKRVPEVLENPIIIMRSKSFDSRLTMFGELYADNKPVLVVLELNPNDRNGIALEELKIASAYGKDRVQPFLDRSDVVYVSGDKKRVSNWEKRTGLQLPVGSPITDSNTTVAQNAPGVNTQSMPEGTEYAPNAFLPPERMFMQALENRRSTGSGNAAYAFNETLGDQLRDWLNGGGKANGSFNGNYFDLGTTPEVFVKHGAHEAKVIMMPECVVKITGGKHSISLDEIAKLPVELNDPVLLFKGSVPNSFVALTELTDKQGNDVIAAVHINKRQDRLEVHRIASLYSKSDEYGNNHIVDYVDRQINAGNLLDASTKKAPKWFTSRGLQLPKLVQTIVDANTTVAQNAPGVNTQSMSDGTEYAPFSFGRMEHPVDIQRETSEQAAGAEMEEKQRRRQQTEKSRQEADLALMERVAHGEITPQQAQEELADRRREVKADIDRQFRTGNRGPKTVREQVKEANRQYRENYRNSREIQEQVKEANRQYRENYREQRDKTALRQRAAKTADELRSMLTHPTKKRHIPANMAASVAELLEAITEDPADIETDIARLRQQMAETSDPAKIEKLEKQLDARKKRLHNVGESLGRIRQMYEQCKGDDTFHGVYNDQFAPRLALVQEMLSGKTIGDLDAVELQNLVDILQATATQAQEYNKLHSRALQQGAAETGKKWTTEMREAKTGKHTWLQWLNQWQLTPERFFNMTSGWKKNSAGEQIAQALADAESTSLKIKRHFNEMFRPLANDKEYDRLTDIRENHLVDVGLVDEQGRPIRISRGMMLSLYEGLQCYGNRQAIIDGGLVIPDMKMYYAGDSANAYKKGQRLTVTGLTAQIHETLVRINQATQKQEAEAAQRELAALTERANQDIDRVLDTIEQQITDYEKKLLQTTRQWFDGVSKDYLNGVTREVWDYESARVDRYYPIHRDTDFVNTEIEALTMDRSLENMGTLKNRVRSKAPVLLTELSAELATSSENTARFVGYLPFTTDFQKIYNGYSADHADSVKNALGTIFGKGTTAVGVTGQQYIENLLADIAGARKSENTILSFFRRNAVRATMSANLRVAVSQLSALPTAAAELGWKYTAKAMRHIGKISDAERERMLKHSEYLYERSRGAGGMEEIQLAKEGNNPIDKFYNGLDKATKGKIFGWCQSVDVKTVSTLWFGCKEKIKDSRPDLKPKSEEFYDAVGKELNRVIRKTQANSTVADRSDLLRTRSDALKFLTMFKNDANQSFNILYEATARYKKYRQDHAEGKNGVTAEDVQQAKEKLISGYTGVIAGSVVAFALLRALVNFLTHNANGYRDKNGEITGASVASAVGQEMLSSISGMVVFGDLIYEVFAARAFGENYYGVSDMALESMGDLLNDIATGNYTTAKGWQNLVEDLLNVAGIPYKNAANLVKGLRYHIEDIYSGKFLSMDAGYTPTDKMYYNRLYNAIQKGDDEKGQSVLEYLLLDGKTEAQINSGLGAVQRSAVEDFINDRWPYEVQEETAGGKKRKVTKFYSDMTDAERRRVLSRLYTKAKQQYTDEEADDTYFQDIMRRLGYGN